MMGIVCFDQETIQCRQRQLIDMKCCVCVSFGHETEFRPYIEEDVRELAEGEVAVAEDRRSEVRAVGGIGRGGGQELFH